MEGGRKRRERRRERGREEKERKMTRKRRRNKLNHDWKRMIRPKKKRRRVKTK